MTHVNFFGYRIGSGRIFCREECNNLSIRFALSQGGNLSLIPKSL
jgi:hypothetical protein